MPVDAQAAKEDGWTAARADRIMCTQVRNDVPDREAFRYVPCTGEPCRRPTKETIRFMNRHAVIDAELGQLRPVTCGGVHGMCSRSGLLISRKQGLRYDAGFAVPGCIS